MARLDKDRIWEGWESKEGEWKMRMSRSEGNLGTLCPDKVLERKGYCVSVS